MDISTVHMLTLMVGRTPGAEWGGMHRIPSARSLVRTSLPRSAASYRCRWAVLSPSTYGGQGRYVSTWAWDKVMSGRVNY